MSCYEKTAPPFELDLKTDHDSQSVARQRFRLVAVMSMIFSSYTRQWQGQLCDLSVCKWLPLFADGTFTLTP